MNAMLIYQMEILKIIAVIQAQMHVHVMIFQDVIGGHAPITKDVVLVTHHIGNLMMISIAFHVRYLEVAVSVVPILLAVSVVIQEVKDI